MEVAALCLQSEQDVTEKQIEDRLTPIRADIAAIKTTLRSRSDQQSDAHEGQQIPKNFFARESDRRIRSHPRDRVRDFCWRYDLAGKGAASRTKRR